MEHASELLHLRVKKVGIQHLLLSSGWLRTVARGVNSPAVLPSDQACCGRRKPSGRGSSCLWWKTVTGEENEWSLQGDKGGTALFLYH